MSVRKAQLDVKHVFWVFMGNNIHEYVRVVEKLKSLKLEKFSDWKIQLIEKVKLNGLVDIIFQENVIFGSIWNN